MLDLVDLHFLLSSPRSESLFLYPFLLVPLCFQPLTGQLRPCSLVLTAEFRVSLYFSNLARLMLKQTVGASEIQKERKE